MKTSIKSMFAVMLVLSLLVSVLPLGASAASDFPPLIASRYCEMVAGTQIDVYKDQFLSVRGTSTPNKAYNARIDAGDLLQVIRVTSTYSVVKYPTPNGVRVGVVRTSDLFGCSSPSEYIESSQASVTTYVSSSTANRSGSIDVGDEVFYLSAGNGFVLVMYTARSRSRAYKAAYVTASDYERMKGFSSFNPTTNNDSETQALTYGLYQDSGRISCGYDSYRNTKGRHEGIDMVRGIGSAVYSLTDGVVTRVTFGSTGSSGLSTIAIYNAEADKTIVYLHTAPMDGLYVGQEISRGQQIATESWRGVSSSSGAHTHVEVRNGKRTAAAKSVGDYNLENPDPTSFWNNQGYSIQ